MIVDALILAAVVLTAGIMLYPPIARATLWRATITPLASIIGSGFLVIGPILDASFGALAPAAMLALCALAYAFGDAIRFNIRRIESGPRTPMETRLDSLASWVLAFAYVISVTYYLNLLGAFSVSLTALNDSYHAKLVTTGVFALILTVGFTQGFSALERLEQVAVGIKLAIIAGLLFGLGWHFAKTGAEGELLLNPMTLHGWQAITLLGGLIVTVQGFETSRYLSEEYNAATRLRSMKLAQGLSSLIYLIYIALLCYVFAPNVLSRSETAIIDLMAIVAPILPLLLIAAAISAQFSAAVADTNGAGGLILELTAGIVPARASYVLLVAIGIALTWAASVFEIISYASRAFAAYYAIQSALAAYSAFRSGEGSARVAAYSGLAVLGVAIAIFGTAVE